MPAEDGVFFEGSHSPPPMTAAEAVAAMHAQWDSLAVEQLHARGGMKWTYFPVPLGAWVAESDLGTATEVTDAVQDAMSAGMTGYLPPAVSAEMSRATADWMRDRYGWEVPAESIHPIVDVITGLDVAIEHYSRAGSAVVVPTPAYMPFLQVPVRHGRAVVEVPNALLPDGRETLDLAGIEAALVEGAGLVVLCNPLNPGGRVFSRDELGAVSELVARFDARVFADEVHAPLVFAPHEHVPYASVSAASAAHSVTATSASKAFNLPGLKAAQLITHTEADEAVWQVIGPMASHGASTLGVIANTAAYRWGAPWLEAQLSYLDRNRRLLAALLEEHLPEVRFRMPEGTYIAWLDVSALDLGDDPALALRERAGVALTDGRACGAAGVGHVRMILATPAPVLERIVLAIRDAVRG